MKLLKTSFSKNSQTYNNYSFLQKSVSKHLISLIDFKNITTILDVGSGSGHIYNTLPHKVEKFVAIDISKEMLSNHPKNDDTVLIQQDMDSAAFTNYLSENQFDITTASSSLQWSKDLEKVIKSIINSSKTFAFAIFTDNTFKEIYNFTKKSNFLKSSKEVLNIINNHSQITHSEVKKYSLNFKTNLEMLRYMQKSGISGEKVLSFKETKRLINEYKPKNLEFEVLFIIGNPKC